MVLFLFSADVSENSDIHPLSKSTPHKRRKVMDLAYATSLLHELPEPVDDDNINAACQVVFEEAVDNSFTEPNNSWIEDKVAQFSIDTSSTSAEEYKIVHFSYLSKLVVAFACPTCHGKNLIHRTVLNQGLA